VIGYGLWERRFGSDPNVLGRTITLNEHDFTVIGVAPRDFATPLRASHSMLDPVMMKDYVARPHFSLTDRGSRWLMVMGRSSRATCLQAQANVAAIAGHLEQEIPANQRTDQRCGLLGAAVAVQFETGHAASAAILMAAVAVVLLIACANVRTSCWRALPHGAGDRAASGARR